MQNISKMEHVSSLKNNNNCSSNKIGRKISEVVLAVSLIMSGEAYALLPENATGSGDFTSDSIQSCNFSRVKIGKVEGILTAAHCLGNETKKDLAFFYGKTLQYPEVSEKFQQLPTIKLSESLDKDLIGKEVYIPGHIEDTTGENKYFFRLRGVVQRDENSKLFHIQISEKDIMKAKIALKRTTSIWKGISASPVILASDDSVVGIARRAKINGESIYFSGPENIRSFKTPPQK